jgi:hypothetical protein
MDDEKDLMIELPKRNIRQERSQETERITINIPKFMEEIIEEEAAVKGKSKSLVITYLIYSGLKAHVGTFKYPAENTIMKNYLKRGKIWKIPK